MIGQRLSHYRVVEQIGAGGMGVVYRAVDEQLGRDVAIKVLPAGILADDSARRRFRNEALALAKLNHPNVATVFEFGTQDGTDFLVTEYIPGITLDDKLAQGPLPLKDVLRLGRHLTRGLGAAHEKGIVHRDLKPGNLRLMPDGHLKILDFGLAQYMPHASETGLTATLPSVNELTGTLPYMAPEQLKGEVADARTDIWSVGAVLYEMATGKRPFIESTAPMLIDAILNRTPSLPHTVQASIPAGLENVILKALEKDPDLRYQSCRELRIDLDRLSSTATQQPAAEPRSTAFGSTTSKLQIAYVLSIEVISGAARAPEQQQLQRQQLQSLIQSTTQFQSSKAAEQVLEIPSSDGFVLVFFNDPEAPARCAQELSLGLKDLPDLPVRMGIHSGPVYRTSDNNINLNATGSAVHVAQQVMSCGDAGHILVSETAAGVLGQFGTWQRLLRDLGEARTAQGVRVHVYNLASSQLGNTANPSTVRSKLGAPLARGLMIAGGLVVIAVAILGYLLLHRSEKVGPEEGAEGKGRRSIAVLGFKNLTARPEAAWLSTALSQMLTTELAAGESLRTVPGENVARMKLDLGLPDTESLSPETMAHVGKNLNADLIVLGSYVALAQGKIRLDLRLEDLHGETLLADAETGDEQNLFDLVSRAGAKLREKLGAKAVTADQNSGVQASLPANPEAAKLYFEGLAKLRVLDSLGAKELLQKAVTADPNHALAHSALAESWSNLGYDEKARQAAKNAFDLSASLSREERFLVEARYREASKEWDNAAGIYRTLFGFFPDNLEYGLLLANAQTYGGKAQDALSTVSALRRLPNAKDDGRIDLTAAKAAYALGDFKQQQDLSQVAADKAKAQGSRLLMATSLRVKAAALENLHQAQAALAPVEEARGIFQAAGDRNGVASTHEVMGNLLADQGNLSGAIASYRQELAIAQEVGNKRAESSALNNLALVLGQQGDREGARKMYEHAMASFREIGDKGNVAEALINIGGVLKDNGDVEGARKIYEQALSTFREINDKNGIAEALSALGTALDMKGNYREAAEALRQSVALDLENGRQNPSGEKLVDLGDVLRHQGDLPGAGKNYQDALSLSRQNGDKGTAAYALYGLGAIALQMADFQQARKNYDEALSIRTELGELQTIGETEIALAELGLEEGYADSADTLRKRREEFRNAHNDMDQVPATIVLADTLVAQRKAADAQAELSNVTPLVKKTQSLTTRLDFALAQARVDAALGKTASARTTLAEAMAEASRAGCIGYQLQARLQREQIEVASGHADRTRIQQLIEDAKAKNFLLIARKASTL